MVDVCYIIHNKNHVSREPYIDDVVSKIKKIYPEITVKMIWKASGNELSENELQKFIFTRDRSVQKFKNECSLTLHHIFCLNDFLQESSYNKIIILEDDCFINSEELLQQMLSLASTIEFDTVYLGDGCQPDLHINKPYGLIRTPWSRCTESILYSKEGAKKIIDYFNEVQDKRSTIPQLDLFFNTAYKTITNYVNYHSHPSPMSQGSCKRGLQSTV